MLTAATTRWRIPNSLPRFRPIDPTKLRSSGFCLPKTDNAPRWPPVPPPISPSHLIETGNDPLRQISIRRPRLARRSAHAPHRCTPLIDSPGAACPELAGADMQRLKVWSGFDPKRANVAVNLVLFAGRPPDPSVPIHWQFAQTGQEWAGFAEHQLWNVARGKPIDQNSIRSFATSTWPEKCFFTSSAKGT